MCVIIGNSLEYANPTVLNVHYFILVLYIFHMPLFAFVSGYFNNKSSRNTQEKVIGTLKIYILAQVFYVALNRFMGDSNMTLQLFTPQWTMWYFVSLMSFYIISDFIKSKKKWFIFSILAALFIGFDHSVGSYGSVSRTFFFLPFFIAGMSFDEKYIETLKKHKYKLITSALLCLGFLFSIAKYTPVDLLFEYSKYTSEFDRAVFPFFIRIFHYISAFALSGVILIFIPKKKTVLSVIGQNSVVMYLIHAAIIKILNRYDIVSYSSPFNVIFSEIIILTVCICITLSYSQLKYIIKTKHLAIEHIN